MNPEPEENTQQQIVKILRTRGKKKLTELATILGKSPSTISYHLDALSERAIIVADQTKYYRVAEEGDIEKAILEAIVKYGKQKKSDLLSLEELSAFGEHLSETFHNLITKGLLVDRDGIMELTRWGTNKLGVCLVCNKPVTGLSTVSYITDILVDQLGEVEGAVSTQVTSVLIHPKCFRKIANDMFLRNYQIQIPDDCFCDYCGLPLAIGVYKMLVGAGSGAKIHEIRNSLSGLERKLLGAMQQPWIQPLTCVEDVERLLARLAEEASKHRIAYASAEYRRRIIWLAVERVISNKQARLDEFAHTLYGPIEVAYSKILPLETPWIWDVITAEKESTWYYPDEANFSMVFVGDKGERLHPYCAYKYDMNKESTVREKLDNGVKNGTTQSTH